MNSPHQSSSKFNSKVNIPSIPDIPALVNNTISFKIIHDGAVLKNDGKDWQEIEQPVKSDVLKLIDQKITNFDKTDVKVLIGEQIFNCHKILLDCYSGYFDAITLKSPEIILPADKINPKTFIKIYEWMLASDDHKLERSGIMELYAAAKFLRIKELTYHLYVCFGNLDCFNEDTAFVLYWEARMLNESLIQELMLPRIQKFFLTVVATTEYLEMTCPEICSFLTLNTIGVRKESDVFYSAMTWLNDNWDDREKYVLDVMKCVRFNLMSPWELTELRNDNKSLEVQKIAKITGVLEMIDSALA